MALATNSPLYLISVATTSVTITLTAADSQKFSTAAVINTGADPVFLYTSVASGTAVYPTTSATASYVGTIIPTGRHIVHINPNHGYINLIRKAAAATADVAISLGDDY